MKIVTVVGARPQFIKAAIVSRSIAELRELQEVIVHTGQHYDQQMSQVFFDQLNIPRPTHNLKVGSAPHGRQTGQMLAKLEEVFEAERPDAALVYGDTNSTLAGALAAAKMHIPVVHVEAGLRSFNRQMPEEINRVLTDDLATLLLCPTQAAVENLHREGCREGVHLIGDVMYDASKLFAERASDVVDPLTRFGLVPKRYVLMTCHRAENTDDPARLSGIVNAANETAKQMPVVFPIHPRTRSRLSASGASLHSGIKIIDPVPYLENLMLQKRAGLILTDSGGMQKEAFFFGVPCVTTRNETEWIETVDAGANILAGAESASIMSAVQSQLNRTATLPDAGPYYGGGLAAAATAERIRKLPDAVSADREAA